MFTHEAERLEDVPTELVEKVTVAREQSAAPAVDAPPLSDLPDDLRPVVMIHTACSSNDY